MPRKPLSPGEPGDFSEPKWNEARKIFQISCLVGEPIGKPSRVWASGKTKRQAKDALKRRVAEWKPRAVEIGAYSAKSTVAEAVRAWLQSYENNAKKRPQNSRTYRREIEPSIGPRAKADKVVIVGSDLGKMKAVDVKPFHIRLHLEQLNWSTTKQNLHKSILNMTFQMLVDDGLRDYNPVSNVKGHRGENATWKTRKGQAVNPYFPDEPQPFTPEEMALFRHLEAQHFGPENRRYRRDPRFLDYTMLAYELAARPGEAVAVRWTDVDFDAGTVTVAGTIVDTELRVRQVRKVIDDYQLADHEIVVPEGWRKFGDDTVISVVYRQPFTKTRDSMRTIKVSTSTLAMLRKRKLAAAPRQTLVLPSRSGKVLPTVQLSKVWRRIVKDTELEWSTLKTLRSTRATRVAEVHGLPAARLILGHEENSPVTTQHYVAMGTTIVVDYADAR
ncbi:MULTISPECIES: tyrosine-type recombinase/integrase [unclassified Nocardia]|uniref:tyrosine-type recombinase/integrase n=1 Tax=unclassified Nocardia TaxID=2637762 RepID=UPI001CE458F0|nr:MULTISPECIES: tyrosine-type recombinase/integrase [unclassified Nocardia]